MLLVCEMVVCLPSKQAFRDKGRNVRGIASQPSTSNANLREAQLADDTIHWIINAKEKDEPRPEWSEVA